MFKMKSYRTIPLAFLLAVSFMDNANSSTPSDVGKAAYSSSPKSLSEIQSRTIDPLNPRVGDFHKGEFPVGFYIYGHKDIEKHLQKMAELGSTSAQVLYTDNVETWESVLKECRNLNLSILAQLDTVYLTLDSNVQELIPRAVSIIQRNKDNPNILAFSVKEEPSKAFLPLISEYYTGIYKEIPDAPIYMLHNYLGVINVALPPFPAMQGTDRYPFWWEFGTAGNRATPASGLRWYHTQLNAFYQESLRQNGEFFAVFNAGSALETPWTREKVKASFYPKTISEDERERLTQMVERLAKKKNQGWFETESGALQHWKYYEAPKNTVRAMSWLAVMEGAKAVYLYHWIREERRDYPTGAPSELQIKPELIQEFSEFAKGIQRYGRLVRAMVKEFTPYKGSPVGHEVVESEPIASPPVKFMQRNLEWRTFRVNGYKGKIVVAVNTDVGEWCDGRSPEVLTPDDQFRIGEKGELLDYKAYTKPRTIKFSIPETGMACLDLETGNALQPDEQGTFSVPVAPGGGRIFFVYPKDSIEAETLKKEFHL